MFSFTPFFIHTSIFIKWDMKEQDKAVTVHAIQAYRGRRAILLLLLDLGT